MVETESNFICQHFEKVSNRDGFIVCRDCGLVFEREINYNINPSDKFKNNHISKGNTLRDLWNLGTKVQISKRDIEYRNVSSKCLHTYSRLAKLHKYYSIQNDPRKRFINLLNEVGRILSIPDYILDDAMLRFLKIIKLSPKVINHISLLIYCLWDSIRYHKYRTHFKELLEEFKSIGHYASPKLIIRDGILYSKLLIEAGFPKSSPKKPIDYIYRHIADLQSNKNLIKRQLEKRNRYDLTIDEYILKIENQAIKLLKFFNKRLDCIGNNPLIISAGIVYIASLSLGDFINKKTILNQSLISKITGVPLYTLRDLYNNEFKPLLPITQYKRVKKNPKTEGVEV